MSVCLLCCCQSAVKRSSHSLWKCTFRRRKTRHQRVRCQSALIMQRNSKIIIINTSRKYSRRKLCVCSQSAITLSVSGLDMDRGEWVRRTALVYEGLADRHCFDDVYVLCGRRKWESFNSTPMRNCKFYCGKSFVEKQQMVLICILDMYDLCNNTWQLCYFCSRMNLFRLQM